MTHENIDVMYRALDELEDYYDRKLNLLNKNNIEDFEELSNNYRNIMAQINVITDEVINLERI